MIATATQTTLPTATQTVVCLSTLQIDATAIGALFRETRATGEAAGIQGAIVSDGDRVAHMLHGAPERVMAMLDRIRADERFSNATTSMIQNGAHDAGLWLLSGWKAGWATSDLMDGIVAESSHASNDMLTPCMRLLLRCDLL